MLFQQRPSRLTATNTLAVIIFTLFFMGTSSPVQAEEQNISHGGLTLNAELSLGDGAELNDGVILIVHGTLAHNAMETIVNLTGVLNERGLSTLAINLSLGIDNRHGMYDCAVPHRHGHMDALDEIDAWLNWLEDKGAGPVTLLGHSRGGSQAALFAAEREHSLVQNVTLLAPATWSAKQAAEGYEKSHGTPLSAMLDKAEAQIAAGNGAKFLEGTGLLYCPDSDATAESFVSYYRPDARFDTPGILKDIALSVLVIAGSEDTVVPGLKEKVDPLADGKRLIFEEIDGADHFFLDLFAEDIADFMEEFLTSSE